MAPIFPPSGAVDIGPGFATGPSSGFPGGGPGTFVSRQNAGSLPQITTLFLPEERPIPGATIFNTLGSKSTAAIESNVEITAAAQQVAKGCIGRLQSVVLYVDNLLQTSNITFSVLADGNPIQGLTNVGIFPGVVARAAENFDVFIRIPQGVKLTVTYTNNDGGTYLVGAALYGWFWQESLGRQYMQQGQAI